MSEVNSRHSEPMKAQNAILRLSRPMLVAWVMSHLEGLESPAVDAEQQDRGAEEREPQGVRQRGEREHRQDEGRQLRPPGAAGDVARRRRHGVRVRDGLVQPGWPEL